MQMRYIEDLQEFLNMIQSENSPPVIVDFTAEWCGPCKMMAPVFEHCSGLEPCKNLIFVKVDVDKGAEIANFCNVKSMPTFKAFYRGSQVGEFVGGSKDKLVAMVNDCLSMHHYDACMVDKN